MKTLLNKSEHLKEQAKMLRKRAAAARDANVKRALLATAAEYEHKAQMQNRERLVG